MHVETNWAGLTDEELALHGASRLDGAVEELISRYGTRIRNCAHRMALDHDQAEDLVQQIYLRLLTSLPTFEGRSAFATWLYRLVHNTCIDAFRRDLRQTRSRATVNPDGDPDDDLDALLAGWGDPEAELDHKIQNCYLGWVLSELPAESREIIRLRLGEHRSNDEVAQVLGTTVDAVKGKLRRARGHLRERLSTPRRCPTCGRMGPFSITASGKVA